MKKNHSFILIIYGIIQLLISCVSFAQQPDVPEGTIRPNIVWIVCEDMSLHLSCFGEKAIQTPYLDALAADGVKYTNVYTNAGVCAPSRNGIITGMYPISIGGDNMRNFKPRGGIIYERKDWTVTSYSIIPPDYVKCFPEYLRKENYYCTNNSKEDYQFEAPVTVWDESSGKAHWRNRPEGKPFFSVFNLYVTHESQIWQRDSLPLLVDPAKVEVPPYYPDVPEVRHDIARNLSNVVEMDKQAGRIIQQLKQDGLYDNTIIFFYSDHGDGLPFVKREITKRGLHIPMIIKLPRRVYAGQTDDQLISGVDFGPTVLSLTGIPIPWYMQGQAFLGSQKKKERHYIFGARDRMDSEVDRVRSVYDGKYQYLKNYMPGLAWYQEIQYRMQMPMMKKILEMKEAGKLNANQIRWFQSKPDEELYDTEKDPYQFNNLAKDPAYRKKMEELKTVCNIWLQEVGDVNTTPEQELRNKWWGGKAEPPVTATPVLEKVKDGYVIHCATPGASIGYRLIPKDDTHLSGDKEWQPYNYGSIVLNPGDKIIIRAQRIGYEASQVEFSPEE